MTEEVLVVKDKAILRVTLNRPEKHNALSRYVLDTLHTIFVEHAVDETLKAVVLTGAGTVSFAAGGDLRDLGKVRTLTETRDMSEQGKAALNAIRTFPVPVVAALNGNAMGGGAELAVACDFRIAAAHASIGFIQGRLNISTAWGGGIDLMRLVGPDRALRLLCSSEMLSSGQAKALGLIDVIAESKDSGQTRDVNTLQTEVSEFLQPVLRQTPQVLRAFKALVTATRQGASPAEIIALETRHFVDNWIHPDHWAAADKILDKK
jgi:enoyl-CoA hydratase